MHCFLLAFVINQYFSFLCLPHRQNAVISKLLKECVKLLRESGDTHPEVFICYVIEKSEWVKIDAF